MASFRFAVQCQGASSAAAWASLLRRVETLGYSTLFLPDHLDGQWAPLPALSAAAVLTDRLRLGTLVLDNDYRHPLLAWKELTTLDVLASGRLEIGLGAGWMRSDYDEAGIAFDPAEVRIERLAESLAIMRQLWEHEEVTFAGKHYRLEGARGLPRPCSVPRPALIVGGGGRRILELAAREADIIGVNTSLGAGVIGPEAISGALPERFDQRIRWIRDAAGERFGELELQCLTYLAEVGRPQGRRLAELAPLAGVGPEVLAEIPLILVGTIDEVVETLLRRRERYGFSYVVIHEPELEAFAPIVARLQGT